jgi:predicted RND superfamily exporter protein
MFFILPAILSWQSRRSPAKTEKIKPLSSFSLEKISRFLLRSPKITLIISIFVTLILGLSALGVTFDSDFRSLRPKETPAFRIQDEIGEKFGSPSDPLMIIASGENKEEVLQTNERIVQRIEELKKEGSIEHYQSPASLLSSKKRVRKNIQELREFDFERIIATFKEALLRNGFRIEAYQNYLDEMRDLKARLKGPISIPHSGKNLEKMTKRYLIRDEKGFKVLALAYPEKRVLSPEEADEFGERIKGNEKGIEITGVGIIASELKRLITKDFILATVLAFSGVFIMLLIHFRRIKVVILALIPLICGIIWMLGIMRLIGLKMNFVNVVVTPLILGIGIDDGIHIIHRYLEKGPARRSPAKTDVGGVEDAIHHTGRAVVMTSLTTMVGFGSLVFAQYRGLATMGGLALLGVGLCLIASLTILPALLKITEDSEAVRQFKNQFDGQAG